MQIVCGCGRPVAGRPRPAGSYVRYRYLCPACGARYAIKPPKNIFFLAISGSHAYGFARPDSDIDWRGVFLQRAGDIISLRPGPDTIARTRPDLTLYSLLRWGRLLTQGNGNVLENLFQPKLVEHRKVKELQRIVLRGIISKAFYNHYRGYAWQCWLQRAKGLKWPLHTARLLLTGIRLFESGRVETDLLGLNRRFKLQLIDRAIAAHRAGRDRIKKAEIEQLAELFDQFEAAKMASALRERPEIGKLDDFIFKLSVAKRRP